MDDEISMGDAINPLNLGVIGLGRGFRLTLPALVAHPEIRLVAACDPREEARAAFAHDFAARGYEQVDDFLADPDIDAVYIASPHDFHATQAIAVAHAGKHILVEKPMALSVAECMAMVNAAKAAGVVLVVGPSHGFDAPVRLAAEMIESGAYGRPRMITALNCTDFLYRPRRPEELDATRGGGVVWSQAAHQIDVVRRVAGGPPESIRATVGEWDSERPCDGAYNAFMTFAGGASATLTYSGYGRFDSDELMGWVSELGFPKKPESYGEARRKLARIGKDGEVREKMARAYGPSGASEVADPAPHHEHFGFVLVSCERGDLRLTPSGVWAYADLDRRFFALDPPAFPRSEVIDEFVGAIHGGRAAVHDGLWGATTMACCAALLESGATQREIKIPSLFSA